MKIAIAGYGVEGEENLIYFKNKFPEAEFTIVDEKENDKIPGGVSTLFGKGIFSKLNDFDLVVRTAGLNPNKIKTNGKVTTATNEFFNQCKSKIIGVTGTKGKGTTCSFITEILKAANKKVHLVGNIGIPALKVLNEIEEDDFVVYEMSSFQLWDLKKSPDVSVVLMIEPDHLDVHKDFDEYISAKSNIAKYQTGDDITIYNPTNKFSEKIAKNSPHSIKYNDKKSVYFDKEYFYYNEEIICPVSAVKLPGVHNLENASAAILAVKSVDKNITNEEIQNGLSNFHGLAHRLKYVDQIDGVKFYDDSISTTPGSVLAAIKSFNQPKVLILGGKDKGGDYDSLAREIAQNDSIQKVVLMGENGPKIKDSLINNSVKDDKIFVVDFSKKEKSMVEAVDKSKEYSSDGGVVILSPASSSFDLFKNYKERGQAFVDAVKKLN